MNAKQLSSQERRRRRKTFLVALGCVVIGAGFVLAQSVYTPAAGSAERKAIMDVLREPCEKDLGRKVIFRVQHLRLAGDWAFARVVPIQPNGKDIDYSRTKYAEAEAEGAFGGTGEALLRRNGSNWKLLEWRFGASDTEVDLWLEKHRFPRELLN
jgi:hypothetical protein